MPKKSARGRAIVINGVEGWGKTTLGAHADGAAFILAPQETGYLTLFNHELVPARPYVEAESWDGLLNQISAVAADPGTTKVLVLDALGGFERLCHEHVCRTQFNGDWGERGFMSFHKGYELSVGEWLRLLQRFDRVLGAGVDVLFLAHAKIEQFSNPSGKDYSRYACDCHKKTWGVTHKWADAVLFATFFQVVNEETKGKGKGIGGTDRVAYTQHADAWDAKNRFGLPECIDFPDDPAASWSTLSTAINRKAGA